MYYVYSCARRTFEPYFNLDMFRHLPYPEEELIQAHADGHLDAALTTWSHRCDDNFVEVLEDEQRLETAELVGRIKLVRGTSRTAYSSLTTSHIAYAGSFHNNLE